MRRPVISLVLTAGLLRAAPMQYFDINTVTSGMSELPDDFRAKRDLRCFGNSSGSE